MGGNLHGVRTKNRSTILVLGWIVLLAATARSPASAQTYISAEPIPSQQIVGTANLAAIEGIGYANMELWSKHLLNDCQIVHPFVSDFHAVIEGVDGRLFVRDLQSKNGIYDPGGARIAEHSPADLTGTNNELVIGKIVHVRVETFEQHQPVGARVSAAHGAVIGNRAS